MFHHTSEHRFHTLEQSEGLDTATIYWPRSDETAQRTNKETVGPMAAATLRAAANGNNQRSRDRVRQEQTVLATDNGYDFVFMLLPPVQTIAERRKTNPRSASRRILADEATAEEICPQSTSRDVPQKRKATKPMGTSRPMKWNASYSQSTTEADVLQNGGAAKRLGQEASVRREDLSHPTTTSKTVLQHSESATQRRDPAEVARKSNPTKRPLSQNPKAVKLREQRAAKKAKKRRGSANPKQNSTMQTTIPPSPEQSQNYIDHDRYVSEHVLAEPDQFTPRNQAYTPFFPTKDNPVQVSQRDGDLPSHIFPADRRPQDSRRQMRVQDIPAPFQGVANRIPTASLPAQPIAISQMNGTHSSNNHTQGDSSTSFQNRITAGGIASPLSTRNEQSPGLSQSIRSLGEHKRVETIPLSELWNIHKSVPAQNTKNFAVPLISNLLPNPLFNPNKSFVLGNITNPSRGPRHNVCEEREQRRMQGVSGPELPSSVPVTGETETLKERIEAAMNGGVVKHVRFTMGNIPIVSTKVRLDPPLTFIPALELNSITPEQCHQWGDLEFMKHVRSWLASSIAKGRNNGDFALKQQRRIFQLLNNATLVDPTDSTVALFVDPQKAAEWLQPNKFHPGPIFTRNAQPLPLVSVQTFLDEQYDDDVKVHVQDPAVKVAKNSPHVRQVTLRAVKERFAQGATDKPWNCLELATHFEDGLRPHFLNTEDCRLLTKLKFPSAGDFASRNVYYPGWKEIEKWALLAQSGALTEPHQDSHGYNTYITVNEGIFGFGWLSNPTPQERANWNASHDTFINGTWHYAILRAGQTVYFPSGTVHFVFRLPAAGPTLAFGGHVLRCSQIVRWMRTILDEQRLPNITNEDLTVSAPAYLDRVEKFVLQALKAGPEQCEKWGGKEAIDEFLVLKKEFDDSAKASLMKKSRKMRR